MQPFENMAPMSLVGRYVNLHIGDPYV